MGRAVKCYVTNEVGSSETFFQSTVSGVKKYFKSKDIYNKWLREKQDKKEACAIILEILGFEHSAILNKEITLLNNSYSYDIILLTVQKSKEVIDWAVNKKLTDSNEFQKVKYLMAIIKNKINDVAKSQIINKPQKEQKLDIDLINDMQKSVHTAKDITNFLEDD